MIEIGHDGAGFAFDCEGPRHRALIEPFRLANRLISNQEWVDFINDDGYRNPLLWLSEGWARVNAEAWAMPLYWQQRDDTYWTMTLRRSEEHTSELQSLMRISYAVFCLKKKKHFRSINIISLMYYVYRSH